MIASLVDRLTVADDARSPALQLRESLRRDLETLLNSRRHVLSWPEELTELDRSLVNYGLDDLVHESLGADKFRERFAADVERLVRRLEPRISAFEVTVLPNQDEFDRTLRLRMAGLVTLGRERHELTFDSHLDPVRSYLVMRG